MTVKKFYNPELETTEEYTEVWKTELVTVRKESNLLVKNHYWRDSDGELWGSFDDPNENIREALRAYFNRIDGDLAPEDLLELGIKLNLAPDELKSIIDKINSEKS